MIFVYINIKLEIKSHKLLEFKSSVKYVNLGQNVRNHFNEILNPMRLIYVQNSP